MRSNIECNPESLIKVFTKTETTEIENQWKDAFCKKKQGLNIKAYKWHIFSGNAYPSIEAEEALKEYDSRNELEYIVKGNDGELAILTRSKPKECNCSDYYVFPINMAWTMAFTHEDGWLGPYFAYHSNYEMLNKENKKKIQKQEQIEIAKEMVGYKEKVSLTNRSSTFAALTRTRVIARRLP